jgi:hypothetical protein
MQPGVRKGSGLFKKKLLLQLSNIGTVTDIQVGQLGFSSSLELGVAGNYGVRFFDLKGNAEGEVDFGLPQYPKTPTSILKRSPKNELLFFHRESSWAGDDILFDIHGKELWRLPYSSIANTFGDLNGDGAPELIFASNDGTIGAWNLSGELLWRFQQTRWAFGMQFLEAEDNRPPRILINDQGRLVALSANGGKIFVHQPLGETYFGDFSITRWPGVSSGQCLLTYAKGRFLLLTAEGDKTTAELTPTNYADQAMGVPVAVRPNQSPVLAVGGLLECKCGQWFGLKAVHGELFIFDASRRLIWDEVLPERIEAMAALPTAGGKGETLLVGGENKVWQYSLAQSVVNVREVQ